MSNDSIFQTASVLVLAVHLGALASAGLGRRLAPLLVVNAAVAAAVLAYELTRLPYALRDPWDGQVLLLMALEIGVLAAAVSGLRGDRRSIWASCAACGLHICASLVAIGFAFLLRIDRLM